MKYSALTWVKATIDESLKQTQQALEQFVENPNDTAPLQQCVVWLHEIYGVLKMLELQTAALLVQEVKVTTKTLLTGKIAGNEKTYDLLMRALVELPNYLDHLSIVQQDIPLALLPSLNGLRSLRGEKPLTALNLFAPDLSTPLPNVKAVKLADNVLKAHVNKLRAAYQKGLMSVIKNPKSIEGLKFTYSVMQKLQQLTGTAPITKVWWVSEGLLEALLQKGLEVDNAILNLFKQIDTSLKQIITHGNAALRIAPPKPLLTNLLYFSAQARSKGKQITAVKTVFKLNEFMATESALQVARLAFSGPDIELMKVVVTLLKDDFARVEEALDIFNRADNPSVSELSPLVGMLRDMANTLGLLGLPMQRKSMLEQANIILTVSEGRKPAELATLLDIANGLLRIGAALDILAVQGIHARQRLQQTADTAFWETPQFSLVLSQVVDEAKAELAQVIQPLVTFIDSGTQDDELLAVPNRLREVEGFLATLSHDRAAKLLAQCNHYIEKTFVKESKVPAEDILKALADVLIGMESFLETLAGSPMDAKEILDIIEKRLKILASS